jgi:NTE family protein
MYKCVLMNGCGVSGAAHLGFLWSIINKNKIDGLTHMSGTSIASIIGFLYCLGIPVREIAREYENKNLLEMLVFKEYVSGLADSEVIVADVVDIAEKYQVGASQMTFKTLKAHSGITLVVNATRVDVTSNKLYPTHFSVDTMPDMLVLEAIRLSINIPILFNMQSYAGEYYFDGLISCDLPIQYMRTTYGFAPEEMLIHRVVTRDAMDDPGKKAPSVITVFKILLEHYIETVSGNIPESAKNQVVTTRIDDSGTLISAFRNKDERVVHLTWTLGIHNTNSYLACSSPSNFHPAPREI